MIYKLNFSEGVVEFVKNYGRAFLEAEDAEKAIVATRELFGRIREIEVQSLGSEQFLVNFKVALDYRLPLVRKVERAVRLFRNQRAYTEARYIERYMVATVFMESGAPDFLAKYDIKEEIGELRKAAVVAREVPNVVGFIDYDIAIYNYLELNRQTGYRSRVVREVKA